MRSHKLFNVGFLYICTLTLTNCTDARFASMSSHSTIIPMNSPDPLDCNLSGQIIKNGSQIEAFQDSAVDSESTCQSEIRTCTNGVLSGSFVHLECIYVPPSDCIFNGSPVANGSAVLAYDSNSVPAGGTCVSQTRQCSNGILSGNFTHANCSVAPSNNSCTFNGQPIPHGQSVDAYLDSVGPNGDTCQKETRLCNNGILSGSYTFATCDDSGNPQPSQSCLFNGVTIPHNGIVPAYQSSTVSYGDTCVSENRVCNNGQLSGSFAFATCQVGQPASCLFNGQTIAHGSSTSAFQSSTVPFGQNCVSEQRTCNNGALSGTFTFGSCTPGQPASCTFNGQTYNHGQTITAHQTSSVPFGQSCASETRTCVNGTFSGNYTFASCSPGQPNSCSFNGQTIAHGQTITNFFEPNPAYGVACQTENRTCSNGTLSGSYAFQGCTQKVCAPGSTESCGNISGGTFQRTCNPDGMGWGACVQSCNAGYVMLDGQCVQKVNECPANEVRNCAFMYENSGVGISLNYYRQVCREDGRWFPANNAHPLFHTTDCAGAWAGIYGWSQGVGVRDDGSPLPW